MKRPLLKIIYACTLLLILLSAIVGQKVHIFTEDPLHFEAFCRNLSSDNGAQSQMVEKCAVDNFYFFPCVCSDVSRVKIRFILLGDPVAVPTSKKCTADIRPCSLRAPPVGV